MVNYTEAKDAFLGTFTRNSRANEDEETLRLSLKGLREAQEGVSRKLRDVATHDRSTMDLLAGSIETSRRLLTSHAAAALVTAARMGNDGATQEVLAAIQTFASPGSAAALAKIQRIAALIAKKPGEIKPESADGESGGFAERGNARVFEGLRSKIGAVMVKAPADVEVLVKMAREQRAGQMQAHSQQSRPS
jgi:hypothetical protein